MAKMQLVEESAKRIVLKNGKTIYNVEVIASVIPLLFGGLLPYLGITSGGSQAIGCCLLPYAILGLPLFLYFADDVKIVIDAEAQRASAESRVFGRRVTRREIGFDQISSVEVCKRANGRGVPLWAVRFRVPNEKAFKVNYSTNDKEMLQLAQKITKLVHKPIEATAGYL